MGRIKTKLVKRITHDLVSKHRDKFTTSYIENKIALNLLINYDSKKIRNMIAGYITRLVRKSQ